MSDKVTVGIVVFFLVVLLAGYRALKPDRFAPLGGELVSIEAQIDGESKTVSAVLAWEQSGLKIYGFWLFPTKGRPVLYCEEHSLRWALKDDYRMQVEAMVATNPPVPRWRYFLGSLAAAAAFLMYLLISQLDAVIVDRKSWQSARGKNTFGSYKNYLVKKHRPKLFARQARRRMMAKIGSYRTFYAYLTSGSDGEQRDAMLRILDHIARSGDLNVGVSFKFENGLKEHSELIDEQLAKVRRAINLHNPGMQDLQDPMTKHEVELKQQRTLKVESVKPCFGSKHNTTREKLLTGLLDRVFSRIFPERILVLVYGANAPVEIRVGYRVSSTGALFRRTKDADLPLEKQKTLAVFSSTGTSPSR